MGEGGSSPEETDQQAGRFTVPSKTKDDNGRRMCALCVHVCIMCVHMYVCMCLCPRVYAFVCVPVYVCACVCTCLCVRESVCVCMACVCGICVHVKPREKCKMLHQLHSNHFLRRGLSLTWNIPVLLDWLTSCLQRSSSSCFLSMCHLAWPFTYLLVVQMQVLVFCID